ncbi:uncharacterized protein [Montipora foliosa]|uniref:uncharacterized protein isoform X2 n=1 Tax=Montipora foliosa TaxID=591990 RepID=UPI0035F1D3FB
MTFHHVFIYLDLVCILYPVCSLHFVPGLQSAFCTVNDGYVESLQTVQLNEVGVHVYVAKVKPFMKIKTDEGKDYYNLWFILEGRGANRGSVLQARCECKGGRDGGCKHIATAMYSLENLLNTRGKDSVTSGPCTWVKRQTASTVACELKDLLIEKAKKPSSKKRKRKHTYSQNIQIDVRAPEDTNPPDEKYLRNFTQKMCQLPTSSPVILPLFKKLYCTTEADTDQVGKTTKSSKDKLGSGIMKLKLAELLRNDPNILLEDVLRLFSFSDTEINYIENTTTKQWQCDDWYLHKAGFITALNCKRVFTRQEALEKNSAENATKLVQAITSAQTSLHFHKQKTMEPQNAREWGLFHEDSARNAYKWVASHTHHKLELIAKGFLISKSKPFLGASVDNIQKCQCSKGCPNTVVEYKCPWKHRDLHPKKAFLTPEIGGIKNGDGFALKSTSKYYFQVQLQMFVTGLELCQFVVWTKQGIFSVEVPYDATFMSNVCAKLERFWIGQVLPFLMTVLSGPVLPDSSLGAHKSQDVEAINSPDVPSGFQRTSSEADDKTCQSNIFPSKLECHEVIDLLSSQHSTPATPSESVLLSALEIYKEDVETVQPNSMITDTIVLFLFKQLPQCYPIVSTFFYTTLCGEQDVNQTTSRIVRQKSAEKFFQANLLNSGYVINPINRSLHWLVAVLTPWHLLIMDSLTWDINTRHAEIDNINRFLDHLSAASAIRSKTSQRTPHVLKDLPEYESDPNGYVKVEHLWFDPGDAETKRTLTRTFLEALFVKK